jgi:hypothetical protein
MCHFITAVLPADADAARVEDIARRHGRVLVPLANAHVARQLAGGERHFRTTPGHCDCGTPLGRTHRDARRDADTDGRADKWRRAGWSEAKIARALGQRSAHRDERSAAEDRLAETELAGWVALVEESLGSRATRYLGLLLHFGDTRDDFVVQRATVPSGQPVADALAGMPEGMLTVFGRARAA